MNQDIIIRKVRRYVTAIGSEGVEDDGCHDPFEYYREDDCGHAEEEEWDS